MAMGDEDGGKTGSRERKGLTHIGLICHVKRFVFYLKSPWGATEVCSTGE